MPLTNDKIHEYSELCLGEESKQVFLRNVLTTLGYEHSGPSSLFGLSGLEHLFDAIGKRNENILLVSGGAAYHDYAKGKSKNLNPKERMEQWRNKALLSAYDVQSVLTQDNLIVDLMFFQNVNNKHQSWSKSSDRDEWRERHKLPKDIAGMHTESVYDVPVLSQNELLKVANSIGASFLTLNDLTIDEIAALASTDYTKELKTKVHNTCKRLRLLQYFNPPTDELLLSAYDLNRSSDPYLPNKLYDTSMALGHIPTENELVPSASFKDPVETAKQLEKHKYIEFESKIEITQEGRKVTQSIRKTAQGSFVIRVLKTLGLPDLAKAIIQAFEINKF